MKNLKNKLIILAKDKIVPKAKKFLRNCTNKVYPSITIGTDILIDFLILFILFNLFKMPIFYSNIISTSVALLFNYLTNKNYILRHKNKVAEDKIRAFLVITFCGFWLIQPMIITITKSILDQNINNDNVILIIGKILASMASIYFIHFLYIMIISKKQA